MNIGYARVSTEDQNLDMQIDALKEANCDHIYEEKIACHAFRHTFASYMVIRGASIYDVKELLGHKSIYMTQIYANLSENATRRSVDLIDFNPNSGINPVLITSGHQRKGA